jgi:UDP-N-acetylmuramoylalanine--D-glutamate ligase
VRFYNDSKSTTPESTLTALRACGATMPVHLIAGGYDKQSDLSPIAAAAARLRGLYTIGATGRRLAEAARSPIASYCDRLDDAVEAAAARAAPGEMVLLSPGCASWDQFENFEKRGDRFVELVRRLEQRVQA